MYKKKEVEREKKTDEKTRNSKREMEYLLKNQMSHL